MVIKDLKAVGKSWPFPWHPRDTLTLSLLPQGYLGHFARVKSEGRRKEAFSSPI